jgi:hypothetical protein
MCIWRWINSVIFFLNYKFRFFDMLILDFFIKPTTIFILSIKRNIINLYFADIRSFYQNFTILLSFKFIIKISIELIFLMSFFNPTLNIIFLILILRLWNKIYSYFKIIEFVSFCYHYYRSSIESATFSYFRLIVAWLNFYYFLILQ